MELDLTKKEIAEAAGYTYRRLFDIDAELSPDKKLFVPSGDGKYSLTEFIHRWVQYNIDKSTPEALSWEDAKARHEQIKIQKTELEVGKLRGELVEKETMHQIWATALNALVQNLMRLPAILTPLVYMVENRELVSGLIEKEIRETLTNFANTPLPEETEAEKEEQNEDEEAEEEDNEEA